MEKQINQDIINLMPFWYNQTNRFALVKYGAGIVQMSGSIAGTTFARNRYGNYARARTKPTNPSSDRQIKMRSILSTLTTRWSQTLSAAQRTAWNLYATSVAMTNKLGETVYLSGFNHYIRSNSPVGDIGNTYIDDGPTLFELPSTDGSFAVTVSEATQTFGITFDDGADWCSEDNAGIYILQGLPQNAQRNFFKGPWRGRTAKMGAAGVPITSPQEFQAIVAVAEDQKVWLQARIMRADGRLSGPFFCNIAVGA